MQRSGIVRSTALLLGGAVMLTGCGPEGGGSGGDDVVRAPARAGEVWEVASASDRAAAPAALLAYVTGLHVMVVDGRDAFTGMTRMRGQRSPDGGLALGLRDGLTVTLMPAGDSIELRFSSGETIPMRRRAVVTAGQ